MTRPCSTRPAGSVATIPTSRTGARDGSTTSTSAPPSADPQRKTSAEHLLVAGRPGVGVHERRAARLGQVGLAERGPHRLLVVAALGDQPHAVVDAAHRRQVGGDHGLAGGEVLVDLERAHRLREPGSRVGDEADVRRTGERGDVRSPAPREDADVGDPAQRLDVLRVGGVAHEHERAVAEGAGGRAHGVGVEAAVQRPEVQRDGAAGDRAPTRERARTPATPAARCRWARRCSGRSAGCGPGSAARRRRSRGLTRAASRRPRGRRATTRGTRARPSSRRSSRRSRAPPTRAARSRRSAGSSSRRPACPCRRAPRPGAAGRRSGGRSGGRLRATSGRRGAAATARAAPLRRRGAGSTARRRASGARGAAGQSGRGSRRSGARSWARRPAASTSRSCAKFMPRAWAPLHET